LDRTGRLAKTVNHHHCCATMSGTRHLQRNPVMVATPPLEKVCSCQHCTMCDPTPKQTKDKTRFCRHGAQSTLVETGTDGHACTDSDAAAGNFTSNESSNNWSSQKAKDGSKQTNGNIYNSTSTMLSPRLIGCYVTLMLVDGRTDGRQNNNWDRQTVTGKGSMQHNGSVFN
jgi:hypothetical protein